jgi:MFS family permease
LAHSFAALFAARAVVGLGEAALSPAAISLISDYFPPSQRGSAVGLYFTGIAIGVGGSIFIGGAVLHGVSAGLMSATPFATWPPWRLVLLIIAAPSLLWGVLVLAIREPTRRLQDAAAEDDQAAATGPSFTWKDLVQTAPLYGVAAIASLVDNAVGAWAPSLMIRRFRVDPARVGIDLGLLLMLGYGGGMLLGGLLADMARARRGRRGKVELCLVAALAILPVSLLIDAANLTSAMVGVPLYFFLSAVVTASGLSAILDASPNRVRGAVMAVSFFLNVAIGAGFGPTAVSLAGDHLFGAAAGLGPAIAFTVAAAYAVAAAAACLALGLKRSK